jgi:hypothetical protein
VLDVGGMFQEHPANCQHHERREPNHQLDPEVQGRDDSYADREQLVQRFGQNVAVFVLRVLTN